MEIIYRTGNNLDLDQVIQLYIDSTLGARRPVSDRERMRIMLSNASLVITAWDKEKLVGISRCLTDFAYVTYLSDLAVDLRYQHRGIGKELIRRTRELGGSKTMILLLAAPAAEKYYPHIGFRHHSQAWILREDDQIT